ncbi:hypothetical protein K474DRAFT_1710716 [Panus rudis PR-1116 ss-1]|nr:hypothetical protein K474DRAFT_1710716 [Panus rudis PR-1116 ss-1]
MDVLHLIYPCNRCNIRFRTPYDLENHFEFSPHHNICITCDEDFPSPLALKEHYAQSPRHPYCQPCDSHFWTGAELELHYENEHDYCGTCQMIFNSQEDVNEHHKQNHPYCTICRVLFTSYDELNDHWSSTHMSHCRATSDDISQTMSSPGPGIQAPQQIAFRTPTGVILTTDEVIDMIKSLGAGEAANEYVLNLSLIRL